MLCGDSMTWGVGSQVEGKGGFGGKGWRGRDGGEGLGGGHFSDTQRLWNLYCSS